LPAIMQVSGILAASPAVKHGQLSMMPKRPDRQQVGQSMMLRVVAVVDEQSPQTGRLLACRQQKL